MSEQTIAIKKDAKKAVRALQCDDDVMNKVSIIWCDVTTTYTFIGKC